MQDQVKVSLVIKSHLNDAMIEMSSNPELADHRLRFVQYLVHFYPNTNQEIIPEFVYSQFEQRNSSK
jgi:hypothetical protein